MLCSTPTPPGSHQNKCRMLPADLQHSTSVPLFLHASKSSRRWGSLSAKATTQICWQDSDNEECPYIQPWRAGESSRSWNKPFPFSCGGHVHCSPAVVVLQPQRRSRPHTLSPPACWQKLSSWEGTKGLKQVFLFHF